VAPRHNILFDHCDGKVVVALWAARLALLFAWNVAQRFVSYNGLGMLAVQEL